MAVLAQRTSESKKGGSMKEHYFELALSVPLEELKKLVASWEAMLKNDKII